MSELTRVLLVDDTDAMRACAAQELASACVIIGTAKDGPMALEAAAILQPDVIVLDLSMPGMSGLEVAERLRTAGSTAALVFLSVHADAVFVRATAAAGGLGYVVKGRIPSDLVTAVLEARAGRAFVSSF